MDLLGNNLGPAALALGLWQPNTCIFTPIYCLQFVKIEIRRELGSKGLLWEVVASSWVGD